MMQENQLNDTINQNENTKTEQNINNESNNSQNNMHKQDFQHVDNSEQNKSYLLILGGLIVLSGLSLLFVSKFKRKKLK